MKRNKRPAHPAPARDPLFDIQQVASFTECTGLLPAQIQTEEEGEAVSSLESIHPIQARTNDGDH